MSSVIELQSVAKSYGRTRALDDCTWSLPAGSLFGFLGPNGAGKTTTIRILLGFLRATSGRATVFGMDAWRASSKIRARVGYLPGDVRLYGNMTGRQTVTFFARARGAGGGLDAERLADVLELDLGKRVRAFSKGMRQKLGLILAMMHLPELLILDEPSAGLDPLMQQILQSEVRNVVREGRTVLFSSHSLAEVEQLCDHVVILREGTVVASESIADLRRKAGHHVLLRFSEPIERLNGTPAGLRVDNMKDGHLDGRWHGSAQELLRWLATLPLDDVSVQPADLEDLFLTYYDKPENADA